MYEGLPLLFVLHRSFSPKYSPEKDLGPVENGTEKCYIIQTKDRDVSRGAPCSLDLDFLLFCIKSRYIVAFTCTRNAHQKSNGLLIPS